MFNGVGGAFRVCDVLDVQPKGLIAIEKHAPANGVPCADLSRVRLNLNGPASSLVYHIPEWRICLEPSLDGRSRSRRSWRTSHQWIGNLVNRSRGCCRLTPSSWKRDQAGSWNILEGHDEASGKFQGQAQRTRVATSTALRVTAEAWH